MKWKEGQQFENPPAGSHIARCYAVIDLGTQPHTFQDKASFSRDVRLSFELPEELMEGKYNPEVKGKPFSVHVTKKQSLHPKAGLRALLEGWRGRKFSKEELEGFDPKKLVGHPCRISLVENDKGYINVSAISPLGKKEKCPKQINPSVFFSMAEGESGESEFDPKVYKTLHEKTREKIAASPEYKALFGGEEQQGEPEHGNGHEGAQDDPAEDDDMPF